MAKSTTIQIPVELKNKLEHLKDFSRQTYADVIGKLVEMLAEENMELSEKTKKEIEEARKRVKEGKYVTLEHVKKELGLE
jgi:predicted transcriptional regulator